MNQREIVALVERLCALPTETEWVEFKRNNYEAQLIGEYISALANEAALRGQSQGPSGLPASGSHRRG